MNKKSKIKSTLDSLFSTGKVSSATSKTPAESPDSSKKQAKPLEPAKKTADPKPAAPKEPEPIPSTVTPEAPVVEPAVQNVKETVMDTPAEKPMVLQNPPVSLQVQPSESSRKKVEEEQARRIADDIDKASQIISGDEEHLVIFTLGKELYGVTIHSVESIIKLQDITEVPRSASFILGVTNLRGTVVPVLDLRRRFNLASCENTSNTRIIIVNAEGSKVGIVVDEVTEVLKISKDLVQPPPPMSTTVESAFINGIAHINDNLVILLDLEKVLASSSRQHNR